MKNKKISIILIIISLIIISFFITYIYHIFPKMNLYSGFIFGRTKIISPSIECKVYINEKEIQYAKLF